MTRKDETTTNPTEDEDGPDIEATLQQMMVTIEPVLNELFKAAAEHEDYWMKKKTVRVFSDWIVSVLNVSQLMEQQVRALGATLQAQEKELEQVRPEKSKVWTPGV